ncbi:unnamed protein product [Cunninghamella echinulata]
MLPLFASSKSPFDYLNYGLSSSSISRFNPHLSAAPVLPDQQNNNGDITKFINSFEPFNSFGEIHLDNNKPDNFSSRALHKDNFVSRNIHMTNVLADAYSDIMEIINCSGTIFYINSKSDSLYTRMIIVVFYDLRDAINCYNNIERTLKSRIVLDKVNLMYCTDDMATSIFGLKLLDFHKTKFYLTFLASNSKLRDSKYLDFLKTFGSLRLARLLYSSDDRSVFSVEYFNTQVTLLASQRLQNAVFMNIQMFVSFIQPYNCDLDNCFSPFDEQLNFVSGHDLVQQQLISPPPPPYPQVVALHPTDNFFTKSLNESKQKLRIPSNSLLLSSYTPLSSTSNPKETHHLIDHCPHDQNNINNKPYMPLKPIPKWPFMTDKQQYHHQAEIPTQHMFVINRGSLSSSSSSSFDTSSFNTNDAISSPVKPLKGDKSAYGDQQVKIEEVINGSDKRTTFMIRNIPNKYTLDMLRDFLDATNKGTYDFLYLRFDFTNKCNAGYAFINFIKPTSVVPFISERVGKIWNKFNSEKLCDISYAKIQGKRSLIAKFRNSNVMTQDIGFRPIIFYSNGPHQGEEEVHI